MTEYQQVVGTEDAQLGRMQELAEAAWSWSSRWHPGEWTWFWREHGEPPASWHVATWQRHDRTVAWAWQKAPGRLDLQVHPDYLEVLPVVLGWAAALPGGPPSAVTVLDAETRLVQALIDDGFQPEASGPFFAHLRRDLTEIPELKVPVGYTVRATRGSADAAARAAAHRVAFAGYGGGEHGLTTAAYRRIMASPAYRSGLDQIVEAPGGEVAAFCLTWLDPTNRIAVIEPAGTAPDHRRRGLARAAIFASLRAAAAAGAEHVRVCARGDDAYPGARATYEALGFRRYARNIRLTRDA